MTGYPMKHQTEEKLVFSIDDQLFAIAVAEVDRVYRAMQITPLPDAPEWLLGLANLGGGILPVVDMRGRLAIPDRPIELDDRLVRLAGAVACCFFVDRIVGVIRFSQETALEPHSIHPQLEQYLSGVGKHDGAMVLFLRMAALFPRIAEETRGLLGQQGAGIGKPDG